MFPSVTVTQALANVYLKATRKAVPPAITDTKGVQILALLNYYSQDWANDSTTDWHSLRQIFTVPAPVTTTDTFALSSLTTLNHLSKQEGDFVRILGSDGVSEWDYTLIDAAFLYNDGPQRNSIGRMTSNAQGTCAVVGSNLIFDQVFKSTSPQLGGTIKLPGYVNVPTLVNGTDIIQVDDPQWLECICAADYVRNDVTRVAQYSILKDEADAKYQDMIQNNDSQLDTIYTGGWSLLGQNW